MELEKLSQIINLEIKDPLYYESAFTHRSYLNEHRSAEVDHNERLEFLGDAVLELVVTEFLFNTYTEPEGVLTNWRSALVNGKMLSSIAQDLELDQFLRMSRGEAKSEGKSKQYLMANTFEALIGAIYLDHGYDGAKSFISTHVVSHLDRIIKEELYIDSKSRLQEYTQERFSITPTYNLISADGPDHNKQFVMGVFLSDKKIGEGSGSSKQRAEQDAAKIAYDSIIDENIES